MKIEATGSDIIPTDKRNLKFPQMNITLHLFNQNKYRSIKNY